MYPLIILLVSVGFQNQSENLQTFFFWVSKSSKLIFIICGLNFERLRICPFESKPTTYMLLLPYYEGQN